MPKFRKRPVVVEAVQLRWDTWSEVCALFTESLVRDRYVDETGAFRGTTCGGYVDKDGNFFQQDVFEDRSGKTEIGMRISSLEGTMSAYENDWIIRGVAGEVYPCRPDIFERTYEAESV